jgi:copper transport protein
MPSAVCTTSPMIPRPSPNPDVHPEEGPLPLDLYALGRGLAYLATLALIGSCVYAALIPRWRSATDDDRSLAARALAGTWIIAAGAAGLLILAHLLRAYGQVRSFLEPMEPFTWEAARPVLFQTSWGKGWLAQLVVAGIALPVALLGRRRPVAGLALLGTIALAVAATSPFTGHAAVHPWGRPLGVGLHAVHLVGGGVWLGALFSMVLAGLGSASRAGGSDHAAVARMVAAFSPVALTGAALAVAAGSLMAYAYIGDLPSLFGTAYGRTLLVKVGLLALTMALGAWNWRRVAPRLGTPGATRQLTRSATIELVIGVLLVATTAVLVALPAPQV